MMVLPAMVQQTLLHVEATTEVYGLVAALSPLVMAALLQRAFIQAVKMPAAPHTQTSVMLNMVSVTVVLIPPHCALCLLLIHVGLHTENKKAAVRLNVNASLPVNSEASFHCQTTSRGQLLKLWDTRVKTNSQNKNNLRKCFD